MQKYDLTIVLPGGVSSAKVKAAKDTIGKLVKTNNGKVGKVEEWGERELAYEISKNRTGNFLHFPLELEGASVKNLNEKLKFEKGIIRYLLVKVSLPSHKATAR